MRTPRLLETTLRPKLGDRSKVIRAGTVGKLKCGCAGTVGVPGSHGEQVRISTEKSSSLTPVMGDLPGGINPEPHFLPFPQL